MTKKKARTLGKFPIKAVSVLLLLAIVCAAIYAGGFPDSAVVKALPKYQSRTVAKNGEWFDGRMKYAEYTYEKIYADQLEESGYFTLIDYDILTKLRGFTASFEETVENYLKNGNAKNKTFAARCCFYTEDTAEGDYCFIKTVPESAQSVKEAESYTVYYFDVSDNTLYYLYADIKK